VWRADTAAISSAGGIEAGNLPHTVVTAERPKLVVVYHPNSISPFEIADAARDLCDLIWVLDRTDPLLKPLVALIRRLGTTVDTAGLSDSEIAARVARKHPDGVISFLEQLPLAAAIAEACDLRFHSPFTADLLTNKHRQRLALAEAGVPGPGFWSVSHDTDASAKADLVSQLRYPVVLKPQDGSGSQNTYQVDDGDTLRRLLDEAQGRGEDMLVEEVLAEARPRDSQRFAELLMVDSFVSGGRITHYVVAGHFIPAPPFRGTGSFIPGDLSDAETKAVLGATEAAIVALGVEEGFTDTDVILTPDGPRVLEVNGRIGGQVPTLLHLAGAPPLLPEAMRVALRRSDGDIVAFQGEQVPFCAMYQSPMEAQCLVELNGLDVVAALPGVTRIVADRRAGDVIDWRQGTLSRLFTAYGVADDLDHLYHLYQQIQTSVVARYEMAAPLP
jgi:hypothetical protein